MINRETIRSASDMLDSWIAAAEILPIGGSATIHFMKSGSLYAITTIQREDEDSFLAKGTFCDGGVPIDLHVGMSGDWVGTIPVKPEHFCKKCREHKTCVGGKNPLCECHSRAASRPECSCRHKTIESGLDEFPRASKPSENDPEKLQAWKRSQRRRPGPLFSYSEDENDLPGWGDLPEDDGNTANDSSVFKGSIMGTLTEGGGQFSRLAMPVIAALSESAKESEEFGRNLKDKADVVLCQYIKALGSLGKTAEASELMLVFKGRINNRMVASVTEDTIKVSRKRRSAAG